MGFSFFTEKSCFYKIVVEGPNGEYRKSVRIRDVSFHIFFDLSLPSPSSHGWKIKLCLRLEHTRVLFVCHECYFCYMKWWKWRKYGNVVNYYLPYIHTKEKQLFLRKNQKVPAFSFYPHQKMYQSFMAL